MSERWINAAENMETRARHRAKHALGRAENNLQRADRLLIEIDVKA
jgi:hypothetical protein